MLQIIETVSIVRRCAQQDDICVLVGIFTYFFQLRIFLIAIDIVDNHVDSPILYMFEIDERIALINVLQSWRTFIGEPLQILINQAGFADIIAACDHNTKVLNLLHFSCTSGG